MVVAIVDLPPPVFREALRKINSLGEAVFVEADLD